MSGPAAGLDGGQVDPGSVDRRGVGGKGVDDGGGGFEGAFAATEEAARLLGAAAGELGRAAREAERAAGGGDLGRLHRGLERARAAGAEVVRRTAGLEGSWRLGVEDEEAWLRDGFEDELIAAGRAQGCDIRRVEGRLVSFPTVLRVVPGGRLLRLDRSRVTTLRPSVVVGLLKAAAGRKPRLAPERFIEVLYAGYRLVAAGSESTGTTLAAVHDALTLLPDTRRDYGLAEFTRDLFELDSSGVTHTKSGARVSLPAATGTKGGGKVLSFVTATGEPVSYYAIRFAQ